MNAARKHTRNLSFVLNSALERSDARMELIHLQCGCLDEAYSTVSAPGNLLNPLDLICLLL